ncbi:MAG: hypothetical protein Q7K42_04775 [Candidatus Diapherotrites archaeon]|nr:hypothetical protein [Candidatus Diapherotrites archaeon]
MGIKISGIRWARDEQTKIGKRIIKPKPKTGVASNYRERLEEEFGEGGAFLKVADNEFITTSSFLGNPTIKELQSEGIQFHFVPDGMFFHPFLTRIFEKITYSSTKHIDQVLNIIPEKKIMAVSSEYFAMHKNTIDGLRKRLGFEHLVVTSEEESKKMAVNFLELGDGKILVDKGCPDFIKQLRALGVEVVETAVPLGEFLDAQGGLRCFFGEHFE